MRRYVHALTALIAMVLGGCGRSSEEWVVPTPAAEAGGMELHIVGTIRRVELEGGFFAIRGEDGVTYDPTNLPTQFQKDGLAIEADARRRDDRAGIHMTGPIVDLVRIRQR
ncbi:MAG: hypothetical protein ACJ8B6_15790 [Gemmatimonadales bacterium]